MLRDSVGGMEDVAGIDGIVGLAVVESFGPESGSAQEIQKYESKLTIPVLQTSQGVQEKRYSVN